MQRKMMDGLRKLQGGHAEQQGKKFILPGCFYLSHFVTPFGVSLIFLWLRNRLYGTSTHTIMRIGVLLLALGVVSHAKLSSNVNGSPQELKSISPAVCAGRSTSCSVLMDVPPSCAGANSSCPILMMFHGHGGTNQHYSGNPRVSVFNYDFIGLYPQVPAQCLESAILLTAYDPYTPAISTTCLLTGSAQGELYSGRSGWNDGSMDGNKCAWDQYNCTSDPNDSDFVLATITAMRDLGSSGRVYAYGSSNGANEVQILAANSMREGQLPIVGIAARSGQMLSEPVRSGPGPFDWNQPCAGDNPCTGGYSGAQLSIHDTSDPVIPYAGGARFHSPVFILSDEEASCEIWALQNNCSATQTNATVDATTHQGGSTTAKYIKWDGCPDTAPVELYKVSGGSHVGTRSIRGEDVMVTVFEFFTKVEKAHVGHP